MIIYLLRRVNALRLLSIMSFVCIASVLYADERIISWNSDITVRQESSMRVVEQLTVMADGQQIRHGIIREFPTKYKNAFGLRYNTDFNVIAVLFDGNPVAYKAVDHMNGVRLYIGDKSQIVMPGRHVYTIAYDTNRQIGFFDGHDELYWNVTGLGWPFVIDAVHVQVHIPDTTLSGKKVAPDSLHVAGYTGSFGQKGQDYTGAITPDGVALCTSTRPLWPHEGLTIVVTWPKGVVQQQTHLWYYIRDNLHLLFLFLALLLLIGLYVFSYYVTRKSIQYGPIIPLFHPPADADPGSLRYILKMGYDSTCLASNIVHMAVRGLIIIEHVPARMFSKAHYVLKKRTDIQVVPTELEYRVLQTFFSRTDTFALKQDNAVAMSSAGELYTNNYERSYAIAYFRSNSEYVSIGAMITLGACLMSLLSVTQAYGDAWFWVLLVIQGIMHVSMHAVLPTYTQAGQKFEEEIEGFKMFLNTTEVERLKVIGTPPTKTPELFERYLPYAIAFGVEEQWSQQFASVFKELETIGHVYQPSWYYAGHAFIYADLFFLSSGLGRSLNDAVLEASRPISSSISSPGSSSGSGGGGYSGGGGGGGGGGGW